MAGGFHSTLPSAYRVAFVASVTSKFPSALKVEGCRTVKNAASFYDRVANTNMPWYVYRSIDDNLNNWLNVSRCKVSRWRGKYLGSEKSFKVLWHCSESFQRLCWHWHLIVLLTVLPWVIWFASKSGFKIIEFVHYFRTDNILGFRADSIHEAYILTTRYSEWLQINFV